MDKRCCTCKEIKPITEFQLHKREKDGHQRRCKTCRAKHAEKHREEISKSHKEYYQKNKIKFLEYFRIYNKSERGKATKKRVSEKLQKEQPEKYKARYAVTNAVILKKLPKASSQKCVMCGNQALEWHHHNGYSEEHKLDVVAVCFSCHRSIK